jgi:flagellar biosynthesis regulator FlbT
MMIPLDEASASKVYDEFALRSSRSSMVISNPAILTGMSPCRNNVMSREYYKALYAKDHRLRRNQRLGTYQRTDRLYVDA